MLLLRAVKYAKGEVLDMFTGSGIIAINAAKTAHNVTAVDINPFAIDAARKNSKINGIKNIKFIKSDLFSELENKKFDVIYANPPYLPGKKAKDWIDYALNGGKDGNEIILRLIHNLGKHLKKEGVAFIIISSLSDTEKVYKEIRRSKFSFRKLYSINFFFEELFLIKVYYDKSRNS